MRLKETNMIISFSLLLLEDKCMQDLLTLGVEPEVISAGVQMVGVRTGGAGTVEKSRSGTSRKNRSRSS
jgi:hypothetical protein